MADNFHPEFWATAAAVGPVVAIAVGVVINRYNLDPLRKLDQNALNRAAHAAKSNPSGDVGKCARRRGRVAVVRYLIISLALVSWIGYAAAATATISSLLALAWRHTAGPFSPVIVVWLIVIAGAALPVGTLVEGWLLRRLRDLKIRPKRLR